MKLIKWTTLLSCCIVQTCQAIHISQQSKLCDVQNVTTLIINPQEMAPKNGQSLSTVRKSYQQIRAKFHSRKQVFNLAQEQILSQLDDKNGKSGDKALIGLEEKTDVGVEITEQTENTNVFSTLWKGIKMFNMGHHHKKDKKSQQAGSKPLNEQAREAPKKMVEKKKDPKPEKEEKPLMALTTLQRPPDAGQLVSEMADIKLDIKEDLQQKVVLESLKDALYLGTIHIGTPQSQPIKVAFDTGSEFLAITSSLCSDATTPDRFKFKKFDPVHNSLLELKNATSRCLNQAFDIDKSKTAKLLSNRAQKVEYGSAQLDGFMFEDYTCVQPIQGSPSAKTNNEPESNNLMQVKLKESKCSPFEFLSLYEAKGLGSEFVGILGLSPKKSEEMKKQHFLWSLKEYGLIDRAMVSFSITQNDMKEPPYALFGGYNSSQIVNGNKGLKTFKNYPSDYQTWALLGQAMLYDGKYATDITHQGYTAMIDTGSSQLAVPPSVFNQLQAKWKEDVPNLECKPKHTFCHVLDSCQNVVKKVKPIAFQLSDYIFQMNAEEYLQEARHNACFFVIHKTDLNESEESNLYLIGDLFLKHFYSVYDFDKDEVSLGINTHSKGKVQMFSPSELQLGK